MGNPSLSYGASLAIFDHTALPATRHKWTRPAITPALFWFVIRFHDVFYVFYCFNFLWFLLLFGGCVWRVFIKLLTYLLTYLLTANQASTQFTYPGGMEGWVDRGSLIAVRPGIELTTAWSQVWRPNRYATKPPTYRIAQCGCQLRHFVSEHSC